MKTNNVLIPGSDDYYINEMGQVTYRNLPVTVLFSDKGVPYVRIKSKGLYTSKSVANLVLSTFAPNDKKSSSDIPAYRDGNNHNFSLENLYWAPRSVAYKELYKGKTPYSETRLHNLRHKICKPVASFDEHGNIVKTYNSIVDAANDMQVSSASIARCLRNGQAKCMGYTWMYVRQ